MTLMGGAASFVASDMLLGTVGDFLGSNPVVRSAFGGVFDAKWSAMFKRLGKYKAVHGETVLASPSMLRWASTSSAATQPEFQAWLAAQRAMTTAATVAEEVSVSEGISIGFAAAAAAKAVASKDKLEDDLDAEAAVIADIDSDETGGMRDNDPNGVHNVLESDGADSDTDPDTINM
ncbi:MAG: hypothetical protein SGARI_005280 [Bacillariaceae sp.]